MASLGSPFPIRLTDIRSLLTSFSFTSDRWTSKLKTLWTLPVYLLLRLLAAYNRWSWQVCTMVNDGRYQTMSKSHQWLRVFYAMCCTIFDCMFSVSWQLPYLAAQIGTPYSGRTWKWWHIPQETLLSSTATLVALNLCTTHGWHEITVAVESAKFVFHCTENISFTTFQMWKFNKIHPDLGCVFVLEKCLVFVFMKERQTLIAH